MPQDDPKIIETRICSIMLNPPEQIGFSYIADRIEAYLTERDEIACRELIIAARAFVFLSHQPEFQTRLRSFYECYCDNAELQALTQAFFTDYQPSRTGFPNTEAQNAQTLISQPLGVQKAMARTPIRKHHEALLYSPWPPVVEILCQNPSIRERDILFMASRRPSLNELLEPILSSQWSARTEIRFALAANPSLKASHAMRCALSLPPAKLQILEDIPELHPFIRKFAASILHFMNLKKDSIGV